MILDKYLGLKTSVFLEVHWNTIVLDFYHGIGQFIFASVHHMNTILRITKTWYFLAKAE